MNINGIPYYPPKTFRVLVWKSPTGLYFPDGCWKDVSCSFQTDNVLVGINMNGEEVSILGATVLPPTPGATEVQQGTTLVRAGNIYPNLLQYTDAGFKICIRIKDNSNQATYYADYESFLAQRDQCSACCNSNCTSPVPEIDGEPTETAATVIWDEVPNIVGYEWVLVEKDGDDCVNPTSDGTFTTATSVDLTDLTASTTYCFALRTICAASTYGAWQFVEITTADAP